MLHDSCKLFLQTALLLLLCNITSYKRMGRRKKTQNTQKQKFILPELNKFEKMRCRNLFMFIDFPCNLHICVGGYICYQ